MKSMPHEMSFVDDMRFFPIEKNEASKSLKKKTIFWGWKDGVHPFYLNIINLSKEEISDTVGPYVKKPY